MSIVRSAFDTVENIVKTAIRVMTSVAEAGLALLRGDFGAAKDALIDAGQALKDGIIKNIRNLFSLAKKIFVDLGSTLLSTAGDFVTDLLGKFGEFVTDGVSKLGSFATDAVGEITGFVTDAIGAIAGFVTDVPGELAGLVTDAIPKVVTFGTEFVDEFDSFVDDALQFIRDLPGNIADVLTSAVSGAGSFLKNLGEFGSGLVDGIVDGISNAAQGIFNALADPINSAIETVNNTLSGVSIPEISLGGFSVSTGEAGLLPGVPDQVGVPEISLGGQTLISEDAQLLSTVPEMESGGIIEDSGLVNVTSPPETVIPSDVRDLPADTGRDSDVTIENLTVHASTRREGRKAARGLKREFRQQGIDL